MSSESSDSDDSEGDRGEFEHDMSHLKHVWKDTKKSAYRYKSTQSKKFKFKEFLDLEDSGNSDPEDSGNLDPEDSTKPKPEPKTKTVKVFAVNIIDAALLLKSKGYNPLVVNTTNDSTPGGSVKMGQDGVEEEIFRRSNYCETLIADFFPLQNEMVYSQEVTIFKDSKYKNLQYPVTLDFLACPPIKQPQLIYMKVRGKMKPDYSSSSDSDSMKSRIQAVFKFAEMNKYDTILWGDFGCDNYKNPTRRVIEFFNESIAECSLRYVFFALGKPIKGKNKKSSVLDKFHRGIIIRK